MLALAPPTPANLRACAAAGAARGAALDVQACQGALCADLAPGDTLFVPGARGAARYCCVTVLDVSFPSCLPSTACRPAGRIHCLPAQAVSAALQGTATGRIRPSPHGLMSRTCIAQILACACSVGRVRPEVTVPSTCVAHFSDRVSALQAHAQQTYSAQQAGCLARSQCEHSARPTARGLLPRAAPRSGHAAAGGWIAAETSADAAAALAGAYLTAGCAAEHLAAARVEDALGRPARLRYPGFRQARARLRPGAHRLRGGSIPDEPRAGGFRAQYVAWRLSVWCGLGT